MNYIYSKDINEINIDYCIIDHILPNRFMKSGSSLVSNLIETLLLLLLTERL
jgi:hypothetical protein